MMNRTIACLVVVSAAGVASAQTVDVTGGQTSVLLDLDTLSAAASLNLSGVSKDVLAPGNLGDASVAFGITPRDAAALPTTFSYDAGDFLNTFSGTIEHAGSVFFNNGTVEVGDFTIGFDAARVGGSRSGFFVASNAGIAAILFDVGAPSTLDAGTTSLTIGADLLVSSEFAGFLTNAGLASTDLTGADVGDALVQAVPAPGALAMLGLGGLAAARRRR
jgi:MYXO-CTERM domain-containing protein